MPPVLITKQAPSGLRVLLARGSDPDASMQPLPARVVGRTAQDGDDLDHQWPGFQASARFVGSRIEVAIRDSSNRYRLTLDDAEVELTRVGSGVLRISGLAAGTHEIRLEKLSEQAEVGHFGGFFLPPEATPLPPPERRPLIEFVGDSDTVGYGNTAPGRDCSSEAQYLATDTSRAFGPMTARALGSDYRIIAASGIGLVRNLGGGGDTAMAKVYARALPLQGDTPHDPEPAADVIVIALGPNDYADPEDLALNYPPFADALLQFMRDRRAEAPTARIVLLAFGEYGKDLVRAHRAARDAFTADGDQADLLVMPELARTACHWHPSLNDHQLIARALTRLLESPPQPASLPVGASGSREAPGRAESKPAGPAPHA
ncbi:SGNH/GDSL hydrolase family protein [Paracoccus marinaquae]|uniref:Lipase n=1 Tax=Paracoccus marinaquae TaxID=2841926 RepID=A0ABS6AJ77_9RHOB|nr:SGNH/GDSL hydrolase family protein [Paracoccus marinaquae]MBU3030645.1 lipase [Paracoccus marinaquae]